MADLKRAVKKLVEEFKEANAWTKSEEDVQASFTIALLRKLGWGPANWQVNTGTEVRTGKKPDIVLKDDAGFTVLVIESKAPKRELGVKTQEEQLYRYCGYEGKYWGILTNFVEWRVYSTYRRCIYKEFAFHDLLRDPYDKKKYVDLMGPEGIELLTFLKRENLCAKHGRFDEANVYYPRQEEIRDEFFNKLREWRKKLRAELYKKYGKKYGKDEVDLGTQKILDRLIFIEVCTDKEILAGDVLESVLTADGRFYRVLKSQFERMDELFDTELFANHWVDDANIADKVIEPIIRGVAEVDFAILPVHVIGEVYEDYLGELVREKGRGLTAKSPKATRKAKGIYYTPDYIVDYIVTNTVGELLKKAKTEDDIKKIRVLDPACGSGSFLIRAFDEFAAAYERLLNKKGTAPLFGFDVKRSILENNLYGVDIDPRAVEIAKLNLMIKALEGTKYQDLKGRKLLPNLSLNIRCGNSLVSGDETGDKEGQLAIFAADHKAGAEKLISLREKFYAARDDEEKEALIGKISDAEYAINEKLNEGLSEYFDAPTEENPFNYTVAFPEVFRAGGFDAVIGNPPYETSRSTGIKDPEKGFFFNHYETAEDKYDYYIFFLEKATKILKPAGIGSLITPNTFFMKPLSRKIRRYLLDKYIIKSIFEFKDFVFKAVVPTAILIFENSPPFVKHNIEIIVSVSDEVTPTTSDKIPKQINQFSLLKHPNYYINIYATPGYSGLLEKIEKQEDIIELGKLSEIYNGIQTGNDKKYVSREKKTRPWERVIVGSDIIRYYKSWGGKYVYFVPPELHSNTRELIFKTKEKIIIRQTADRIVGAYDNESFLTLASTFVIKQFEEKIPYKTLLAILNSKLFLFLYRNKNYESGRVFPQIKKAHVFDLPIKLTGNDLRPIRLVDEIMELHKRLAAAKSDADKQRLQRAIAATDRKIDNLVYELYGLTDEEIKIIEST